MEKKGGAFILLVPVGLFNFSFALDLHICFVGFYILVGIALKMVLVAND